MNMNAPVTDEGNKPAVPPLPDTLTSGQLIAMYVKLRDRIKATEQKHKDELAPAKALLEQMSTRLLDALNKDQTDSIAGNAGTAYRTERASASIADGQAFRDHVIANELWDLLDWKANPTAVKDYIAEYSAPPPGVNLNIAYTVGVRRSGK